MKDDRPSSKPRLLFLNPPAPMVVIRDYYCSKTSRSNYLFPPIDFIMQSGLLGIDYQLHFLDAVRDRLSEAATIARVEEISPDIVFFLAGAVNYPGDLQFVVRLAKPGRSFIGSGDIFLSDPKSWLERYPFLDGVTLNFTNRDVLYYLRGQYERIKRMAYRTPTGELVETMDEMAGFRINVNTPCHALFIHPRYRFPFARNKKFSVFLTDFGCPFHCSFCVMSSLPYGNRPNDEALAELHSLNRQGVKELFWINQTFGVKRSATLELLVNMAQFSPGFSWTTFCRPDLLDEQLVTSMKKAGCHTIIIGVESGSEEILRRYHKEYTREQITAAFALCHRHRIRTVGTFILGLPGETRETIRATGRLAQEIDCDFASFHVAVPRAATPLRQEAVQSGKIGRENYTMDQSGSYITLTPDGLDQKELLALKRKIVLEFYLRPAYLVRQLLQVRSFYEWANMAYQSFFLVFSNITAKWKS